MLAQKVLDLAERQGLLDGKAIAELRRQIAESKFIVTPEAIAKVLVDHGHLTAFQARKLVSQALGPEPEPPPPPRRKPAPVVELTLADDDEPKKKAPPPQEEIVELEPVQPQTPSKKSRFRQPSPSPGPALMPLPPAPAPLAAPLSELTPLPDLTSDPLLSAAAGPTAGPLYTQTAPRRVLRNVWDSPLLLVGGGILGAILVAFSVLLYLLTRGAAAEMFNQAEATYRDGAYTSAIAGYEAFLKRYPRDPNASLARVRRGMAQLRQVSDDGKNPRLALQTAQQILPQIENEEQFHEARSELSVILPDIADALATQAGLTDDAEKKSDLVGLAHAALELVNNPSLLPASLRREREARIAGVQEKLHVAERGIRQDQDLTAAIAQIKSAAAAGQTAEAYRLRGIFLRAYPAAETNQELLAATREIADQERQLVEVSEPGTAAATGDPLAGGGGPLVLAAREGPAAGGGEIRPIFVLIEGAVYCLDVGSGRVLWRRYVGFETTAPPLALTDRGTADAIFVDAARREVVRLRGDSGQLVWRQAVGDVSTGCVAAGSDLVITTRKGRVLQIEAATGKIVRSAQLPQGAITAAAVLAREGRPQHLAVLGEHSTLFVLAADSLECTQTYYLGHKAGAIFVPPLAVLDYLLVSESPADDYSLIRALAFDAKTKRLTQMGRPLRLKGRIVTPLAVSRNRAAAVTDLGQVAVLEVDTTSEQEPVRLVAGLEATERSPVTPYLALSANQLWVAARRLSLLELLPSVQRLTHKWTVEQGDTFLGPLQMQDDALIHLRRRSGGAAVLAQAVSAGRGSTLWTTQLAAPLAGIFLSAEQSVHVLTFEGRLFSLKPGQIRAGVLDQPAFSPPADGSQSVLPEVSLSADGRSLAWTESHAGGRIYSHELSSASSPTATPLPAAEAQAAAAAQWLSGKLLVPLTSGSVALLEPGSGKAAAEPFLPPLKPGVLPQWTRPAVQADQRGFVISDGRDRIYRVAVQDQGVPHLALAAEIETKTPVVSLAASTAGSVYGVLRGESSDEILGFDDAGAAAFPPLVLQGRVQSGPFAVEGLVILAAEPDGLIGLDASGQPRWQQPLGHGPLAGPPLVVEGEDLLVIHQSGVVRRLDSATGRELALGDVGQPLGGAAAIVGHDVLLGGSDGVLHRLPLPPRP